MEPGRLKSQVFLIPVIQQEPITRFEITIERIKITSLNHCHK